MSPTRPESRFYLEPDLSRPLDVGNIRDYLRLLIWTFYFPQALDHYVRKYSNMKQARKRMAVYCVMVLVVTAGLLAVYTLTLHEGMKLILPGSGDSIMVVLSYMSGLAVASIMIVYGLVSSRYHGVAVISVSSGITMTTATFYVIWRLGTTETGIIGDVIFCVVVGSTLGLAYSITAAYLNYGIPSWWRIFVYALLSSLPIVLIASPTLVPLYETGPNPRWLGTSLLVVVSGITGFVPAGARIDDWLVGYFMGKRYGFRNGLSIPKVTILPIAGLNIALSDFSQRDWQMMLSTAFALWEWTRQHGIVAQSVYRHLLQIPDANTRREHLLMVSRDTNAAVPWESRWLLDGGKSNSAGYLVENLALKLSRGIPGYSETNAVNSLILAKEYCREQRYDEALAELRLISDRSDPTKLFELYNALQTLLDIERPSLRRVSLPDIKPPPNQMRSEVWIEIGELLDAYRYVLLAFRCQTTDRRRQALKMARDSLSGSYARIERNSRLDTCSKGILLRIIDNWQNDINTVRPSAITPLPYSINKNPFVYDEPVRSPSPLHGRRRALKELLDAWDDSHLHVIEITGPLLSGKTSLFFAAADQLKTSKRKTTANKQFAYVSLKHLSTKTPPTSRIAHALYDELNPLLDAPIANVEELHREPLHVIERMIRSICDQSGIGLVIALDDIEYLETLIDIQAEFKRFLEYTFHLCEIVPRLGVAIIGTENSGKLYRHYRIRTTRAARPVRVDLIGEQDGGTITDVLHHPFPEKPDPGSDKIIEPVYRFTDGAIERIFDLTGGQPYLVQLIAWTIVDAFAKNYRYYGQSSPPSNRTIFEPLFDLSDVDRPYVKYCVNSKTARQVVPEPF